MTMVGSAITADLVTTAASADPATTAGLVTTAASVGPAAMAEATMVEAAATTKPRPALLCVMPRAKLGSPDRGLIQNLRSLRVSVT